RRRRARAVGAAVLAVLAAGVAAGGWWAWRDGAVDVRSVEVRGAQRSGAEAVATRAGDVVGRPLPAVDTAAVEERVRELPLVLDATVTRRWPGTLVVTVREREPVAAVPVAGGLALVDAEAVVVETVPQAPAGLPVVRVDLAAGPGPLTAARTVADGLPDDLAARTTEVSATTLADVRLVLDGREVRWGTASDPAAKADVLRLLLDTVDARVYDVSAPGAPATLP
ncbi:MAG: cell division protein FtsQ/DivIB, partial [Kineosporiaceae bacterium]